MDRDQTFKDRVAHHIDGRADHIRRIAHDIRANPETGFREVKTSKRIQEEVARWGVPCRSGIALTGVKAVLKGKPGGPRVAVIGELDALVSPNHPRADPETGAAHACGHYAQIAAALGAVSALAETGVLSHLTGDVVFMGVPAEELIDLEYRRELVAEGKISRLTGKQELIRLGEFDDVDMVLMFHIKEPRGDTVITVGGTHNGCVSKLVRYTGKAAHAGTSPHLGVNSLKAASLGLAAIDYQRETFLDEDTVRIHAIITKGGDSVNIVPAEVRIEALVRGKRLEAILDANTKTDRALKAGADALGAQVEIITEPGYMPRVPCPPLDTIFAANASRLVSPAAVGVSEHSTGSTDLGDVSLILPAIHPFIRVARGRLHGRDFDIADESMAYLGSAKILAWSVIDLLGDDASLGKEVLATFKPQFTKEEYLRIVSGLGGSAWG